MTKTDWLSLTCYAFLGATGVVAWALGRAHPVTRQLLVAFTWIAHCRYVAWRFTATLPPSATSFAALLQHGLFALELLVTYYFLSGELWYWGRAKAARAPVMEAEGGGYGAKAPRIEILIPTYNEPWAVLERTLIAAKAQQYPNFGVWILDDGRRSWLRSKAEAWNVQYLERTDNVGRKAGNLNHALRRLASDGAAPEFISVLDADCIAFPNLLVRTLAVMGDDRVGIVQTPQCYYNPDPFQRVFGGVGSWPDDTRLWHDEKQPRNDSAGRVLCSGTAYLARFRALQEIGGYPVETVTEDTIVSFRLRGKGWQTRYLNERLSVGLAPEGLSEFLSQRTRWQYGWVQLFRLLEGGAGVWGRVRYVAWLCRAPAIHLLTLSWFAVALAQSWFGFWVFQATARQTLYYLMPVWLCSFLVSWLTNGRQLPFVADVHRLAQSFALLRMNASVLLLGRARTVAVTAKAVMGEQLRTHWDPLKWLIPLALGLLGGLAVESRRATPSVPDAELFWANVAFSGYLLLQVLAAAIPTLELPQRRRDDRYTASETVTVELDEGIVEWVCRDLGVGGAFLESREAAASFPERVTLVLNDVGRIHARLVRRASQRAAAYAFEGLEHRPLLIQKIYCSNRYVPAPERWSALGALRGLSSGIVHFPLVLLRYRRVRASSRAADLHAEHVTDE